MQRAKCCLVEEIDFSFMADARQTQQLMAALHKIVVGIKTDFMCMQYTHSIRTHQLCCCHFTQPNEKILKAHPFSPPTQFNVLHGQTAGASPQLLSISI